MTNPKSSTHSKTVVAIVAATIGLTALTPSAFAAGNQRDGNDTAGRHMQKQQYANADHDRRGGMRMGNKGGMQMGGGRGGMFALGCGPNSAERIDHALVSLSYRVSPTGDQVQLLDDLKAAALSAQETVTAACEANLPARPAAAAGATAGAEAATPAERPDMLARMQAGLKLQEVRVAAMGEVLPKFEAFYNSLTDEQKASLQTRDRDGRGGGRNGGDDAGKGRHMGRNG